MFQFPGFPSMRYGLAHGWRGFAPAGFPHSDIRGSMDICSSPRLFAACHVFLRLLVPRHPPCALISLTDSAAPARHSVAWLVALSCLAFQRLPPPSGSSFLWHALACLWMSDESYLYDFLFSMQFSRCRERRSLTASGSHPWQGLPSLPRIAVRAFFSFIFGGHLLSHAVSSIVPSAARVLTIVFGMGTGVSPGRVATEICRYLPAAGDAPRLRP